MCDVPAQKPQSMQVFTPWSAHARCNSLVTGRLGNNEHLTRAQNGVIWHQNSDGSLSGRIKAKTGIIRDQYSDDPECCFLLTPSCRNRGVLHSLSKCCGSSVFQSEVVKNMMCVPTHTQTHSSSPQCSECQFPQELMFI